MGLTMLLSHVPGYFKQRRETLLEKAPGSVFLFPANEEVLRNPDVHYPFRQESNFQYLSGFDEAESFLLVTPAGSQGAGKSKMVLFVRARDVEKEMWEGERHGTEGARKVFGADEAYTIDELPKRLPDYLKGADKIFTAWVSTPITTSSCSKQWRSSAEALAAVAKPSRPWPIPTK